MTSKRHYSFHHARSRELLQLPRRFFSSVKILYRFAGILTARDERGVVGLIGVIIYAAVFLIVGTTMVATSVTSLRNSTQRITSAQSYYHAESGAEDALLQIKRNANYGATSASLTTTFDSTNRVETVTETVSTPQCQSAKQVTASGYASDLVRRVRLNNCPAPSVDASFVYALQAGANGIFMNNNATIYGTTYSNGNHTGGNNSRVTGDAWVAGGPAGVASPQFEPPGNGEISFGHSGNPDRIDVAQSFVADTSNSTKLVKVSLKVRKQGTPANATVRIVTDNNNKPSGSQVASGTLNAASVGSSPAFIDVSMTTPPDLTNGQKYWIVIDASSSSSNYWAWVNGDGYANGKSMKSPQWRSSGSMTWVDEGIDFAFKVFMGGAATRLDNVDVTMDAHANTIVNAAIGRDAYYQTLTASTVGRTSYPGSADPPTRDLPITNANLQDFRDQAAAGTEYNGTYLISNGGSATLGPIKINGNLVMENNATLVVRGTIWVTGTMSFSNNSVIRLDSGYGSDSGVLVADGEVDIFNNVTFLGSGTTGSFLMLATASNSSRAIDVSNNASNIILAAPNGTIYVQNNGGANALAADRLELANNATVTYVSGLADINFSSGPGGSFQAGGWQEIILN